MRTISSRDNGQYKAWRKLTSRHGRKKNGAYLVESVKLVADALGSGAPVEALIFRQGEEALLKDQLSQLLQRFASASLGRFTTYALPAPLFNQLSSMEHSDGLIGLVQGSLGQPLAAYFDPGALGPPAVWSGPAEPLALGQEGQLPSAGPASTAAPAAWPLGQALLLDRIQDPGNLGTILRSAEAFGLRQVLALDSAEFENPKTLRASMGSAFRLNLYAGSLDDFLSLWDPTALPLVGADMEGEDYRTFVWPGTCLLAIGNEGQGLHPRLRDQLACRTAIPMAGQVESLNAGVSASILMADMARKRDQGSR